MTEKGRAIVREIFGLLLFVGSMLAVAALLYSYMGWGGPVLVGLLLVAALGFAIATGSSGNDSGNAAEAGAVTRIDIDDPNAGIPGRER